MRNTNEKALFAVLFRYSNRLNASYVSIIQRETYYLALSHFKMHIYTNGFCINAIHAKAKTTCNNRPIRLFAEFCAARKVFEHVGYKNVRSYCVRFS